METVCARVFDDHVLESLHVAGATVTFPGARSGGSAPQARRRRCCVDVGKSCRYLYALRIHNGWAGISTPDSPGARQANATADRRSRQPALQSNGARMAVKSQSTASDASDGLHYSRKNWVSGYWQPQRHRVRYAAMRCSGQRSARPLDRLPRAQVD